MVNIVKAENTVLEQCVDIIFQSELGHNYYPRREILKTEMEKGIRGDSVYYARAKDGGVDNMEVLGIVWYQPEGMFHSFPYLHMIAVKEECRGQGIGTALIDFFEQDVLVKGKNHICTKVFLTVADFNPNAEAWYRQRGYVRICEITGLFRKNVTERLMMKNVAVSNS